MATREPPVELFYDPDELVAGAPRLYIWREDDLWRLKDESGTLLSTHPTQAQAINAALDRSRLQFSEILARGSTSGIEWRVDQPPHTWKPYSPRDTERTRGGRRRMMYNLFPAYRVRLPLRRRYNDGRPIARPVELFYDPADLDPNAPRLHVDKREGKWEVRADDGALLGTHPYLADALDAAAEQSTLSRAEILFRNATGRQEFSYRLNPEIVDLARVLRQSVASQPPESHRLNAGRGGS